MLDVQSVDDLQMKVGLGAVARVSATRDGVAGVHLLTDLHPDAAELQVTERDDASTGFDHDVVARQPGPSRGDPATLSERVSDRRDAAVRRVVGLGIEGGDNGAGRRCQYGSSEAGEQRGGLGPQERRD